VSLLHEFCRVKAADTNPICRHIVFHIKFSHMHVDSICYVLSENFSKNFMVEMELNNSDRLVNFYVY
jgi:hypothetical protein